MSSVNKATILGHVGKDPEVRTTQSGLKVVNFSVATSEKWKDRTTGEQRENTEWHKIVVMGNDNLTDIAERFIRKGSKIYVEGKIQTRKWVDNNGVDRYSTEILIGRFDARIVLLGDAPNGTRNGGDRGGYDQRHDEPHNNTTSARPRAAADAGSGRGSSAWQPPGGDLDDDIPF